MSELQTQTFHFMTTELCNCNSMCASFFQHTDLPDFFKYICTFFYVLAPGALFFCFHFLMSLTAEHEGVVVIVLHERFCLGVSVSSLLIR